MQLAEPIAASWKAHLSLQFEKDSSRTFLARRRSDGPLVVQKPLYPEGPELCHAIVVHPPGGIAGGDELSLHVKSEKDSSALLTTPGAAKWYRTAGPWAKQKLVFAVDGDLEWLPRETIVFDGALAQLECEIRLGAAARYIGWEIVCLGRTGSGERFDKGEIRTETSVARNGRRLFFERGRIEGGGSLMRSPAGLGGRTVFGTLVAAAEIETNLLSECRKRVPLCAVTLLPGLLVARYLGDSSEEAMRLFTQLWSVLRPAVCGRPAIEPRIWRT
jgi:urease accessory protein